MNTFKIFESIDKYKFGIQGNENEICKLGTINIRNIKNGSIDQVETEDIVEVVDDAMSYFRDKKYKFFYKFIRTMKIMYIPFTPSEVTNTMAVDDSNNLWINMCFIYNQCDMNTDRVFGILFHEMYHKLLNHAIRFNKKFPKKEQEYLIRNGLIGSINTKSNLAMDLEINTTMVEDNIVTKKFWEIMGGAYNKDYTGLTWEEIYDNHGTEVYDDYIEKCGGKISEEERKIIEAIEKAAKVQMDKSSTEKDKIKAKKELKKEIDKIMNRKNNDDIQDILQNVKNSKLGAIGKIDEKIQDVIDDLYKSPSKMSEEEFEDLMSHIDEMLNEMNKNSAKIADTFKKSENEVKNDIEKLKNTLQTSMKKMRENSLSKDDINDIKDEITDCLEDVVLTRATKEKRKLDRLKRDEKKELERKDKFKKTHPLRKLIINVFLNLMNLKEYGLICENSYNIMQEIVDILNPITELNFSDITKDNINGLEPCLLQLEESLFTDFKKLLDNKIIIYKTEDDIKKELKKSFKAVKWSILEQLVNSDIKDSSKISSLRYASEALRTIGRILKTKKKYRASDEFKKGYREMRDELMSLFKKDKKEVLKKIYDMGLISEDDIYQFDKRSKILYDELIKEGKIK